MKEGFQTIQPWAWTLKKIGGVLGFKGRGLGPGLLGSEARVWFPGSNRRWGGDYPWVLGKRTGSCTPGLEDEGSESGRGLESGILGLKKGSGSWTLGSGQETAVI